MNRVLITTLALSSHALFPAQLTPADVAALFPTTPEQVTVLATQAVSGAQSVLETILAVAPNKRTFANTALALDHAMGSFNQTSQILWVTSQTHPDKPMRDAAQAALTDLNNAAVDLFTTNQKLYSAVKAYTDTLSPKSRLSPEKKQFLQELTQDFKRHGLELPAQQLEQCATLFKEIGKLCIEFQGNISKNKNSITVQPNELTGLSPEFIAALATNPDGSVVLGTDYPTFFNVIENCSVESTRKSLYEAFESRAYPENEAVLQQLIEQRDALAKLLGYPSYAAYDIADQMAKLPKTVTEFVDSLAARASVKYEQEFAQFSQDLPEGVMLTADGKLKPWDSAYVLAYHKKKQDLDENLLAEYFPMEKTVAGLISIYEQFMQLRMELVEIDGLWYKDLQTLAVYDKGNKFRGYIIMDLHPREGKYSHACAGGVVKALKTKDGISPFVGIMIANFPQSTNTRPSLLRHSDVVTFFHEFGHAIHALFAATELSYFSGLAVKRDFVEMPSQMLENWMWDASVLKNISSHYKTGKPLSDQLIATKIALKNFGRGHWIMQQIAYAYLSLGLFSNFQGQDISAFAEAIFDRCLPHRASDFGTHSFASFGHLTGYGSKYYGYLWSLVYSCDLFAEIKKYGLLNPKIGARYVQKILAPGGSKDPNDMLVDFLGRQPNQDAFYKELGL